MPRAPRRRRWVAHRGQNIGGAGSSRTAPAGPQVVMNVSDFVRSQENLPTRLPMMQEQEYIATQMPQQIAAMNPNYMQVAHGLGHPVTLQSPQSLSIAAQVDDSTRTMQYHDNPHHTPTQDAHQPADAPTNDPNIPDGGTAVLGQTHHFWGYRTNAEVEDQQSSGPQRRQRIVRACEQPCKFNGNNDNHEPCERCKERNEICVVGDRPPHRLNPRRSRYEVLSARIGNLERNLEPRLARLERAVFFHPQGQDDA